MADLRKCLPFSNVAANSLATLDLRNLFGYTVNRLILKLGGTTFTKAMLTDMKLKINGKLIFDDTGARNDSRMQYRGIAADAAYMTIDFSEIRSRNIFHQTLGAIDTNAGVMSFTGEFQIGAATAPTLEAWAEVGPRQAGPVSALIGKVLNFNHVINAAGKYPLSIPYGRQSGSLIKRLHMFGGGIVTEVEVKRKGLTRHESIRLVNEFLQKEYQRVPQANLYSVDFVQDGDMNQIMNAASADTMEYYVTTSGAGNVAVVAELLDPLSNN